MKSPSVSDLGQVLTALVLLCACEAPESAACPGGSCREQVERLVIDDFESPVDEACEKQNACNANRDCFQLARSTSSEECGAVFCSEAEICPRLQPSGPGNHVLRLEGTNSLLTSAPRSFGGFEIALASASQAFILDPALDCLTFWIRTVSLPKGGDVELSFEERASADAALPQETNPKPRLSRHFDLGPEWCRATLPTSSLQSADRSKLDFSRLGTLNVLITAFPEEADVALDQVSMIVELDDIAVESCQAPRDPVWECPALEAP